MKRRDVTMSGGNLPKVRRPLITFDMERGRVGWARWRAGKKRFTARYRRRHLDQGAVQEELDHER